MKRLISILFILSLYVPGTMAQVVQCDIVSVNGTTFMGNNIPANLKAVNGGTTGATAGKLELSEGLVIASTTGIALSVSTSAAAFPAASFVGGAATGASYPGGPGIAINGGNADTGTDEIAGAGVEISGGSAFGASSKHAGPAILLMSGSANSGAPDALGILIASNKVTGNINGGPVTAGPLPAVLFEGDGDAGLYIHNAGTTGPGALRIVAGGSDGVSIDGGPGGSGIRVFGGPPPTGGGCCAEPAIYAVGGLPDSMGNPGAPAVFAIGGYSDNSHTAMAGPGVVILGGTDFQADSGAKAGEQALSINDTTAAWTQQFWGGPFSGNVQGVSVAPTGAGAGINITSGGIVGSLLAVPKGVEYTNFTFKLVLSTDNKSPVTGATPTCVISKDNGMFNTCTNEGTITENPSGLGWYAVTLTSTEMSADEIVVRVHAAGSNFTEFKIHTNP